MKPAHANPGLWQFMQDSKQPGHVQEVAEMLERASAALAAMQREVDRSPPCARLVLRVARKDGSETVQIQILPDNFYDIMFNKIQVRRRYAQYGPLGSA
jgi:hypothetical protein